MLKADIDFHEARCLFRLKQSRNTRANLVAKRSATTHCTRWCWRHNALVRQATRALAHVKETERVEKEEIEKIRIGMEKNMNLRGRLSKSMTSSFQ